MKRAPCQASEPARDGYALSSTCTSTMMRVLHVELHILDDVQPVSAAATDPVLTRPNNFIVREI